MDKRQPDWMFWFEGTCEPTMEQVGTPLRFTLHRIDKTVEIIKSYLDSHKFKNNILRIEYNKFGKDEDPPDYIYFTIYINKPFNRKLRKLFGDDATNEGDPLQLIRYKWGLDYKSNRYYYFGRESRPLCGDFYREVLLNDKNHNNPKCKCPIEFKNVCKDLTEIIRENALPTKK